jgi:hypothetical protein
MEGGPECFGGWDVVNITQSKDIRVGFVLEGVFIDVEETVGSG